MKVIKEQFFNGAKYRIVVKTNAIKYDEFDYPVYVEWDEYYVQMRKYGFWITIKVFEVTNETELNSSRPLGLIEAEELFDAIVNPYKII